MLQSQNLAEVRKKELKAAIPTRGRKIHSLQEATDEAAAAIAAATAGSSTGPSTSDEAPVWFTKFVSAINPPPKATTQRAQGVLAASLQEEFWIGGRNASIAGPPLTADPSARSSMT